MSQLLPLQSVHPRSALGCEYCDEFAGRSGAFSRIYADVLKDRIIARSDSFVAFPTLGQIVPGYLLVSPVAHIESLARLSRPVVEELELFVCSLLSKLGARESVVFEHGATRATGGGCGIYHAHLHVLPHQRLSVDEMLPDSRHEYSSMAEALSSLDTAQEYLLFGCAGRYATLDITERRDEFPSQYFRRRVAALLQRDTSWDWREIVRPESALVETVDAFRR